MINTLEILKKMVHQTIYNNYYNIQQQNKI